MTIPTERTAEEFLEILAKVKKRGVSSIGIVEALYLLLMGVYRQAVYEGAEAVLKGSGETAMAILDGRHHEALASGRVADGVGADGTVN